LHIIVGILNVNAMDTKLVFFYSLHEGLLLMFGVDQLQCTARTIFLYVFILYQQFCDT